MTAVVLADLHVTETWYLVLGAVLFTIGAIGLLVRRNPLVMFMCIELMLNAVNLTFVAFASALDDVGGQAVVFFVLVVAAAEVVVGLGIIVALMRRHPGATADDIATLKG
jgi:NADH-quinone oxidoreductase subunit K